MPCPKSGDPATVEDVPRDWVMVDIDDPPLTNLDQLQERLPRELKGVNYVGQLSSSTGHPILGGKLRCTPFSCSATRCHRLSAARGWAPRRASTCRYSRRSDPLHRRAGDGV